MKQRLWKPILLIAVCVCIAGVLFAALSFGKAARAASTTARKTSSCFSESTMRLTGDAFLSPGAALFGLTCSDKPVQFGFQSDGNLVLYIGGSAKWSSRTNGICTGYTTFQNDGNLVVYDCNNVPRWASNTANKGALDLVVQSDGNVVIYTGNSQVLWATGTCCYS